MADMQSPASILTAVVLSLWGVPLALFASLISLQCFKVLCGLLSDLAGKRFKNDLWRATRPYLKGAVAAVEAAFGPARDYKPTSTQVIMVALIIVVIVSAERIIVAMHAAEPAVQKAPSTAQKPSTSSSRR